MKNIFLTLILSHVIVLVFSQTPQIALVKPNGTTTIHATFDAAYTAATDDDYIYLPGGTFSSNLPTEINKRIHIIGAGMNVDSSIVTGITRIPNLTFNAGAAGGSLEGIKFFGSTNTPYTLIFLSNHSPNNAINFSISNCYIHANCLFDNWSNVTIRNCYCPIVSGTVNNSFFTNNFFHALSNSLGPNITISNNIFLAVNLDVNPLPSYCTFDNNIFNVINCVSVTNSIFHNNVNINPNQSQNQVFNTVTEDWHSIFIDPGNITGIAACDITANYDVQNNYHIKPTSACKNSGTDGTDRGVYGGAFPWIDGSVPSNPHIYFKNVAGITNASGQLQVQYKVRTGN